MAYWLEGAPVRLEARQSQLRAVSPSLVESSRARLRLALIVSLAFAGFLGFVIFPPKRLSVTADGAAVSVVSRQQDAGSLLDAARVRQQAGDVLVRSSGSLAVERAVPVVVEVDGKVLAWRTRASSIQALLGELDVDVSPYDTIFANGTEVGARDAVYPAPPFSAGSLSSPGAVINGPTDQESVHFAIKRAVPMTIVEDGRVISFKSSRPTLAMALRDAGVRLGPADEVYPSTTAEVTAGMQVQVKHAKTVNLRLGNSTSVLYTHKESLREALAESGLTLGPDDRVEPAAEVDVTNGMTARLVRVAGRSFIEKEPVVHKTVFKPDDNLSGAAYRIVQGRDGVQLHEFRVVIEDGIEKEKKLTREWFEPEPQDTVIYYAADAQAEMAAGNFTVLDTRRMYGTWYMPSTSGKLPTDPAYGFTYTGRPVTRGVVAVDPRVIPLGTRLFVPGYGFAIAADTGGGVIGDWIDVGYPDGAPVDWRTGWVEVYILGS